jgi:HD-GYP domain-containing protein (c-di-GMP phosphodiesterase class II)
MPTRRVSINQLHVGMYVAKLDVSWFRSPFLQHAFLIQEPGQINKLRQAGVQTVEIDPDRGEDCRNTSSEDATTPTRCSSPGSAAAPPAPPSKSLAQLNEEYGQALVARKRLEQAVSSVFSTLNDQGVVDRQQTTEAIREITTVTGTLESSTILMALSQDRNGDTSLSQHALTTCTLSLLIGQNFNFNPLELRELATAAVLHDIGLLQVPPHVIQRFYSASTPLASREMLQMKAHPRLGMLTLERQGGFEDQVLKIIEEHHALLDGSGYPKEKCGAFTSNRTRIVMLADRYDELITGFGGASPLTPHQTLQHLFREAEEGQLDREILARFIKLVGIYPLHSCLRLNTGEQALVTQLNPDKLHQPIVAITHQPDGSTYAPPLVINLGCQDTGTPQRAIESVLDTTLPHLQLPPSCAA